MKTQAVRVADFLVFGPGLILLAGLQRPMNATERAFLLSVGLGTVIYNLRNFLKAEG